MRGGPAPSARSRAAGKPPPRPSPSTTRRRSPNGALPRSPSPTPPARPRRKEPPDLRGGGLAFVLLEQNLRDHVMQPVGAFDAWRRPLSALPQRLERRRQPPIAKALPALLRLPDVDDAELAVAREARRVDDQPSGWIGLDVEPLRNRVVVGRAEVVFLDLELLNSHHRHFRPPSVASGVAILPLRAFRHKSSGCRDHIQPSASSTPMSRLMVLGTTARNRGRTQRVTRRRMTHQAGSPSALAGRNLRSMTWQGPGRRGRRCSAWRR